jgi:hypothetical protein
MTETYSDLYARFAASGGYEHITFTLWLVNELTTTTAKLTAVEALCDAQEAYLCSEWIDAVKRASEIGKALTAWRKARETK